MPIDVRRFDRWVALFEKTAREIRPPKAADHFVMLARRVADGYRCFSGTVWTKESQRDEKRADSIQRHIIERLIAQGDVYDVIFDDDGSGESADVVAMRLSGSKLTVHLHHCKFSSDPNAGARLDDLYEVCGQTPKSIRGRERPDIFLRHLLKREADRRRAGRPSRFERGTSATVNGWLNRWKEFPLSSAQPSSNLVSRRQRRHRATWSSSRLRNRS